MPTVQTPRDHSTARVIRDTLEMESLVTISRNVKPKVTIVTMTQIARIPKDRSTARVLRDILEMELRVMISTSVLLVRYLLSIFV